MLFAYITKSKFGVMGIAVSAVNWIGTYGFIYFDHVTLFIPGHLAKYLCASDIVIPKRKAAYV